MIKEELHQLSELIDQYQNAIENQDTEGLYESLETARAMYSEKEPNIEQLYENILNYSGTLVRNSRVIVKLLQRLYDCEKTAFQSGIMPLTSANLSVCPAAQKEYNSGISKYAHGVYERNVLDDMRLSIELLVKQLLSNDKSLENQLEGILTYLGSKGTTNEVRNLIRTEFDYLCKYQNHNVKHNDNVNPNEIDFIIEQTSAVINFLIHCSEDL